MKVPVISLKTTFFAGLVLCAAAAAAGAAGPTGRPAQAADITLAAGVTVRNVRPAFDYFSNSWALLGLKDYPDGVRISPQGAFLLAGKTGCNLLAGEALAPLTNDVTKTLDKGYLPIVTYDFVVNGAVEYVIEALARPLAGLGPEAFDGPSGDPNFLTLVRVTMRNKTAGPASGAAGLDWTGPAPLPLEASALGADPRWALAAGNSLLGTVAAAGGVNVTVQGQRLLMRAGLSAQGSASVVIALPFAPVPKSDAGFAGATSGLDFDESRTLVTAFWESLLDRGAKLSVPEDKVLDSYRASLIYQFMARDRGELHPGEGFYDEFYLRDGAYQAISLAHAGFLPEAREGLEAVPRFQKDTGQFVSQQGQLDANGYAPWSLVEYGLLSGENAWLEARYPLILKSLAFARRLRSEETDPASPFFGILPKAPADGENLWEGKNHIVGYDWWNLRAVQSAAQAARRLGKRDDMMAFEREFEDYRAAILKAIDRTGLPYIPPSYEKDGTHWGNLEAVFPTILINPMDRRMTATLDQVRDVFGRAEGSRPGFIEGVMQWTPKTGAIHPYMSLFVTNTHIIRGEQDKAVDGFYSFLLHSTSTQGFPEGVYWKKREAWGDTLPHLWAAALYVTTLRNMLVREEGDDLHLLSAVPSAWLEPGRSLSFTGVPTRFGAMSLTVTAAKDEVVVHFSRPNRFDPERVLIHLPSDLEITEVGRCGRPGLKMSRVRDVFIPGMELVDSNDFRICIRRRAGVPHPDFAAKVADFLAGRL